MIPSVKKIYKFSVNFFCYLSWSYIKTKCSTAKPQTRQLVSP